jgi:hypothetical protein
VAIIDHLAVEAFDEAAAARFRLWLAEDALLRELGQPALDEEVGAWFARCRVTRPGAYRLGRILRSAQVAHDDAALGAWPGAWTPRLAGGSTPCSPTTATAPPTPGSPPIPAGSGWRACWPKSRSSTGRRFEGLWR